MKKYSILFMMIILIVSSGFIYGQEQSGQIYGRIVLEDGSEIAGVLIEINGEKFLKKRMTVTNEKGRFRLTGLPSGSYTLTISQDGYKTMTWKDFDITVGRTSNLDVVLKKGKASENIELTGKSNLIEVRKSSVSKTFPRETFSKLPKSVLNFFPIVGLVPGVNDESLFSNQYEWDFDDNRGTSISINGASASENEFFIDGMNTTTLKSGVSGYNINIDFIDDIQVKTSGIPAKYNGGMGGVVNIVTRGGRKHWYGGVSFNYEADSLTGSPRDILNLGLDTNSGVPFSYYYTPTKDEWKNLQPGFTLGGYILKNKLWFYSSFVPQFRTRTRQMDYIDTVEQDDQGFDYKDTRYNGSLRLSMALSQMLRLGVSGSLNLRQQENKLPANRAPVYYNVTDIYRANLENWGWKEPTENISGYVEYTVGDTGIFTLSGGYYRSNSYFDGIKGTPSTRVFMALSNEHLYGPDDDPDLIKEMAWDNIDYDTLTEDRYDIESKLNIHLDNTIYMKYMGEHVLKLGFHWNRIEMNQFKKATDYENWTFYWRQPNGYASTYTSVDGTEYETTYGYVRASGPSGYRSKLNSIRFAIYLQDTWTYKNKLTVDLGVRIESEKMPTMSSIYQTDPFEFKFFDKFAPRIGFTYDFKGDGSTKLFGSAGLYYDVMKMDMAVNLFGGYTSIDSYYDIATLDWTQYLDEQGYRFTGSQEDILGGEFFESVNVSDSSFGQVQPDLKPMKKLEITLGFQQKLTDNISFTARLLHNRIYNMIESIGVPINGETEWLVGNPGSDWINAAYAYAASEGDLPEGVECPKATREYYSVQLSLDKRFSDNWLGGFSFTWSSLKGLVPGLANSDLGGWQYPMVQPYFDRWFSQYDSTGALAEGPLPTDRPIDIKFYGAYSFDFGLTLGVSGFARSGTPISRAVTLNFADWYPDGRMTDGRTPFLWQVDLYAEYNLKLGKGINLNLNANITNVTDNKIGRRVFNRLFDGLINVTDEEIQQGFDILKLMEERGYSVDPRFLKEYYFQLPIAVRLGAKLTF